MKKPNLIFLIIAAFIMGCSGSGDSADEKCSAELTAFTTRTVKDGLVIYSPDYSRIDLVCGNMPEKTDTAVIFCAEAAFTGELLDQFKHFNVAGNHVSDGEFHKGFRCGRNTGGFVFDGTHHRFCFPLTDADLKGVAHKGGMGFGQETMIHRGRKVPYKRKDTNRNQFRALCELNGKVCVIDSKGTVNFGDFVKGLLDVGVTEALYLDMGAGWNYSWWRDRQGEVHEIHNGRIKYTTNWVTFYGKANE